MTPKLRIFLMAIREALIVALRAIDEYLDLPPTIPTRKQRRAGGAVGDLDVVGRRQQYNAPFDLP